MIALDTNVIVRYFVKDVPEQASIAVNLMNSLTQVRPGFVSREVLLELAWVLQKSNGYSRLNIATALDGLLKSPEIIVEFSSDVRAIVEQYRNSNYDFADLMIYAAARRAGAQELVTFDRTASRLPNVRLLV